MRELVNRFAPMKSRTVCSPRGVQVQSCLTPSQREVFEVASREETLGCAATHQFDRVGWLAQRGEIHALKSAPTH